MRKLGIPDDRCIGGRQSIELDLYNMRRKIVNAKSEVVTRLSSEVNHKRRDMTPRRVQSSRASRSLDDYNIREVRQMYQNVADVDRRSRGKEGHSADAGTLSESPQTYGLAKRISYHRAAKRATGTTDFTAREHYKNVSNMYRRMEEQYSVTERKKNHLDYKLYPCYIRRRLTPDYPTVLTRKPVSNGYSEYTPRDAFGFDTHNPSVSVASPGSPAVGKPERKGSTRRPSSAPPRRNSHFTDGGSPPPHFMGGMAGDPQGKATTLTIPETQLYNEFHVAIMDEIVASRMYQEPALRKLFNRWLKNNTGNARDVLQRVINDLKVELDVK